ncbi:MAG: type II toxin-antitoxin system RelE/ParE family toxin [bacterium]|nr:type II toxin-antitoxin system RelE/ParE family toxin [bacterium]
MIKSFADKETEKIFGRSYSKKIPENIQRRAYRKLLQIDLMSSVEELRSPPGNRLEKLSGNREGQHSIRINNQWRICFIWKDSGAFEVEIVDYHK